MDTGIELLVGLRVAGTAADGRQPLRMGEFFDGRVSVTASTAESAMNRRGQSLGFDEQRDGPALALGLEVRIGMASLAILVCLRKQ